MGNYQAASKRGERGDPWGAGNSPWPSVRHSQLYQTPAKNPTTTTNDPKEYLEGYGAGYLRVISTDV